MGAGVLNNYRDRLPLTSTTPMITMGEGDTPLVKSNRLGRELGCPELYFKLEGCNPTGSFKDRGMVVAIAKALEQGARAIMCASTGNTSASAAAFGAYCDIPTFVLIPKGEVAMGKLAQAMIYGAKVIMINGNFDAALGLVREFTERNDITLVNSVNPNRIEGQKTAAFELVDALGDAPDLLFIPVGNAGNITAYWKGFREYQDLGRSQILPRMMGFQAEGAAPIVRGEVVSKPQTIASAIRIGNPATWGGAVEAKDQSGGVIGMARAGALARAMPGANVVFAVVELCGLTFRFKDRSKSNVIATALFIFILNWSEFLLAVVLTEKTVITVPVNMNLYGGAAGIQAALATVAALPIVVMGLMIHKHLARGFTLGAIKR